MRGPSCASHSHAQTHAHLCTPKPTRECAEHERTKEGDGPASHDPSVTTRDAAPRIRVGVGAGSALRVPAQPRSDTPRRAAGRALRSHGKHQDGRYCERLEQPPRYLSGRSVRSAEPDPSEPDRSAPSSAPPRLGFAAQQEVVPQPRGKPDGRQLPPPCHAAAAAEPARCTARLRRYCVLRLSVAGAAALGQVCTRALSATSSLQLHVGSAMSATHDGVRLRMTAAAAGAALAAVRRSLPGEPRESWARWIGLRPLRLARVHGSASVRAASARCSAGLAACSSLGPAWPRRSPSACCPRGLDVRLGCGRRVSRTTGCSRASAAAGYSTAGAYGIP
ncbi:hypothetical protein FA09DRAFT_158935 [Tilletiopsis washingtonensis]|jgi:hypothetical protein|uniref:Uncharacterized protein n=1 Tax=Tilletiopsis washingtonensis TaxID=58919 RepID=A0A316Z143_9BASI|nr:hypothetical protein FA09DRAFT_158935 [Tilletiopsis washingtonensis]PWN95066.1 hypothetical protein FA09DRAFT_158935 [Tilletiopsis washingtonensis]